MKKLLLSLLICPACLPKERPLELTTAQEADGDIISGQLLCRSCKARFPIRDGIALLLPDPESGPSGGQWRYEEPGMTARYLWSHYRDLLGDTGYPAPITWGNYLNPQSTAAFDAGCSVGRVTFEMANRSGLAVGCDLSHSFIKTARRLAKERGMRFSLPLEGRLQDQFDLRLPDDWRCDNAEFIVADALRLPFAAGSFDQSASLNLLDRVNYPLAHLFEMNRVTADRQASLLCADPFSWSDAAAPEERWLGGTNSGPWQGRGRDNLQALLEGKDRILTPPWRIEQSGALTWSMRTHRNHYEVISSDYFVSSR